MKSAKLSLFLFLGASVAGATTFTVKPGGPYPTVCSAVEAAVSGDTILIDANGGVPYIAPPDPEHSDGRADCQVRNTQNNITIRGINGRPILDAGTGLIEKGILVLDGHDVMVDNLELRNANDVNNPNSSSNAAGIRIEDGTNAAPSGGNITVSRCYIHDNGDGILGGNSGPGVGQWFSATPFITFTSDDFNNNGDGSGQTHNMYIGFDGFLTMKFTLQGSVSTNAFVGHTVKTRAPFNYILNNRIGDSSGNTSYILNFPLGGTSYVIGNIIYKSAATNPDANENLMLYADVHDNGATDPEYAPPNQDLHFLSNIVIDNNPSGSNSFVMLACADPSTASCPLPPNGPPLTTPTVIEGNLFIGQPTQVTNQPNAVVHFNLVLPFSHIAADRYMAP